MSDVRRAGRGRVSRDHHRMIAERGAAMSAKVIRDVCLMTGLVIALVALRAVLS